MENEAEFDEFEPASKTQLKRDSHAIQDLGKRLCALSANHLARIPLDEPVLEAIALAHRIQNKRSALKRHYQFLGKLLRARDTEVIFAAGPYHRAGYRCNRSPGRRNRARRPAKAAPALAQSPTRQNRCQTHSEFTPDL